MIRFGLQLPSFTFPGLPDDRLFGRITEIAAAAEDSGFDSFFVMDHFQQIANIGPPEHPMLEAYTLLAAVAARTSRIKLGALVTGVTYRNPALLAKIVTTLDVISRGRAILGIGAAWNDKEATEYGYDWPSTRERMERLEDAIQICRVMFTQEVATFEGRHHSIKGALNFPRPVQPGGPRIMVGGSGEQRTLRLVAQYADACNLFGDVDTIRHKLSVLERHCRDVGRDPAEITKTRLGTLVIADTKDEAEARLEERRAAGVDPERLRTYVVGDPESVCNQVQAYFDSGLDGLIFNMPPGTPPEVVSLGGRTLTERFGSAA
jgi:F420-dependent oxidoreductase-like protein